MKIPKQLLLNKRRKCLILTHVFPCLFSKQSSQTDHSIYNHTIPAHITPYNIFYKPFFI